MSTTEPLSRATCATPRLPSSRTHEIAITQIFQAGEKGRSREVEKKEGEREGHSLDRPTLAGGDAVSISHRPAGCIVVPGHKAWNDPEAMKRGVRLSFALTSARTAHKRASACGRHHFQVHIAHPLTVTTNLRPSLGSRTRSMFAFSAESRFSASEQSPLPGLVYEWSTSRTSSSCCVQLISNT